MKKSFVFALGMLALLLCVAGCGTQRADFSNGDKAGLVFNKKYIHEEDISMEEGQQTYFMFLSDGTGKYHTYFQYEYSEYNETYSYTVTFRYYIVEDTLHCFYESVQYDDIHDQGDSVTTNWNYSFLPCEKFLMQTNGVYYLNEDFLKEEITSFGR